MPRLRCCVNYKPGQHYDLKTPQRTSQMCHQVHWPTGGTLDLPSPGPKNHAAAASPLYSGSLSLAPPRYLLLAAASWPLATPVGDPCSELSELRFARFPRGSPYRLRVCPQTAFPGPPQPRMPAFSSQVDAHSNPKNDSPARSLGGCPNSIEPSKSTTGAKGHFLPRTLSPSPTFPRA